jgi:Mn-dependent DtxR family transcriptional regulator
MKRNNSQKQVIPKLKKRIALAEMKPIVYIRHSLLKKYDIHIIQYCMIVFLIRVSTKYEYCKIKKGRIAKFLAIPATTFTYHFNALKKNNILKEEKGEGIKICNDEYKNELHPYSKLLGTYNVIDYQLLDKLEVTHLQYCILHSVFITKHFTKNLGNTSIQTLAEKLNASRAGIDKAIKKLEEQGLLNKGLGNQIALSESVFKHFNDLHYKLTNDPYIKDRRDCYSDTDTL